MKKGRRVSVGEGMMAFVQFFFFLRCSHFERASGDAVIAPFDNDGITALVLDSVGDIIELVAHMFDIHLLTGSLGSMYTYHQHVGTWMEGQEGYLVIEVNHIAKTDSLSMYTHPSDSSDILNFHLHHLTCFVAVHSKVIFLPDQSLG